jgi:hypothetical protein
MASCQGASEEELRQVRPMCGRKFPGLVALIDMALQPVSTGAMQSLLRKKVWVKQQLLADHQSQRLIIFVSQIHLGLSGMYGVMRWVMSHAPSAQQASCIDDDDSTSRHTHTHLHLVSRQQATSVEDARVKLGEMEALLRSLDTGAGSHTAAADVLHMAARTQVWFTPERGYIGKSVHPALQGPQPLLLSTCSSQSLMLAALPVSHP